MFLMKDVKMDADWDVDVVAALVVFQAESCYVIDNGSILTASSSH